MLILFFLIAAICVQEVSMANVSPVGRASAFLFFKEDPSIISNKIYVEDVVRCESSSDICSYINEIYLSEIGAASEVLVTADKLTDVIQMEFPLQQIIWSSSENTKVVKPNLIEIEKNDLRSSLKRVLSEYAGENDKYIVKELSIINKNPKRFVGQLSWDCSAFELQIKKMYKSSGNRKRLSSTCSVLSSYLGRMSLVEIGFSVKLVRRFRNMVAAEDILAKRELESKDIAFNWSNKRTELVNINGLRGKISKRRIRKGATLRLSMFEFKKAVRRGQIIDVVVESGSLIIRNKGKALFDAVVGGKLSVQLVSSNKKMSGTVGGDRILRVVL